MDYSLQAYIQKLPSVALELYIRQNATAELLNDPNSIVCIGRIGIPEKKPGIMLNA